MRSLALDPELVALWRFIWVSRVRRWPSQILTKTGLSATAAELQESGVACHTRLVDVSKAPEVSAWCDDVIKEFGQVDGIINNAGVSVIDGAEFVSHEDFEWLMGINF